MDTGSGNVTRCPPRFLLCTAGGLLILLHLARCQPQEGDVHLLNGPTSHEGLVEYYDGAVWRPLCSSSSYITGYVPGVICKQLGFPQSGVRKYYSTSYGESNGEALREKINCGNWATNISMCTHTPLSHSEGSCGPRDALGISCNAATSNTSVRLYGGQTPDEGRVQVFRDGVWGTVCRESSYQNYIWHLINAHVACREMFGSGYGGVSLPAMLTPSRFGLLRYGAIHLMRLRCGIDDDSLSNCSSYSPSQSCTHEMDATVKCMRVPAGCTGIFGNASGILTSPGYSSSQVYSEDTECVWQISTPLYNNRLRLTFSNLHSDKNSSLQVINSNDYNQYWTFGQHTQTAHSHTVTYYSPLYIKMTSAAGSTGIRFNLSWVSECPSNYFQCNTSGRCISSSDKCDGSHDCGDGDTSDEEPPACSSGCRGNAFHCKQSLRCIPWSHRCNHRNDCGPGDVSDEATQLCHPGCNNYQFTCNKTGRCISAYYRCDGNPNCGEDDLSDEDPLECISGCNRGAFHCNKSGVCLNSRYKCDGHVDCGEGDSSDEELAECWKCNINYSSQSNYLDKRYRGPYFTDLDCFIHFSYLTEFLATVTFSQFRLDQDVNGTCRDYVEVFDGDSVSSPSLGRYCGSQTPSINQTSQESVLLHFHTDNQTNNASTGFYVTVRFYEPAIITEHLYGTSGMILSPGYPALYRHEGDYQWVITVVDYCSVTLTFSEFQTGPCWPRENFLEIRDSRNRHLATPCGTGPPRPVLSNANSMTVRLYSRASTSTGNLVNATWTAECRREFTGQYGTIQSPLYPHAYPSDLDCTYLITVATGYIITLTFDSFNMTPRDNGKCNDTIEVFDGSSRFAPRLAGPFCETSLPRSLNSTQNAMVIRFTSNDVENRTATGFHTTYRQQRKECGTLYMNGKEGNFTSPNYPLQYPVHSYCTWKIDLSAYHDYMVELTFHRFDVPCQGSYVRIYKDSTVDPDKLMRTLCGGSQVPQITSNGQYLTIVLNAYASSDNGFNASYIAVAPASIAQSDLFPYGPKAGDTAVKHSGLTMTRIDLDDDLPFGNNKENTIYIGTNGIVSVGSTYPWPDLAENRKVICVYCAYIDNLDSVGGIYYQMYTAADSNEILSTANDALKNFTQIDDFQSSMVVVITWDRVRQGRYRLVNFNPDQDEGEATFQLVLMTDGLTSYALVYYMEGGMKWTYRGSWSYVMIGVSYGQVETYQRNFFSKTEAAYSIDSMTGNTGRKGTWLYKVGSVPPNAQQVCRHWLAVNRPEYNSRREAFNALPRCPCSQRDVWQKTSFMWTSAREDYDARVVCYRLNRASSGRVYPHGKECCYSSDSSNPQLFQQLIQDPPYAGHALAYNPVYHDLIDSYIQQDRNAHDACCNPANRLYNRYCNDFYDLRPVGTCRADIPFRFFWLYGDPHIITLDEREYTFNGLGEYTLVNITMDNWNFTLQGRTGLTVTDNGTVVNATVFTAFGVEENGTRVFVQLDPNTNNSLIIYGGAEDYTVRFQQKGDDFLVDDDHYMLKRDNHSLIIAFPSEIILSISPAVRSLVVSISMPMEFQNLTRGLLGNFNGVKEDDFILPNGTTLSNNLTDRDLHYLFGNAWAVSEENSVLRYGPRENSSDYARPHFQPVFMDELPPSQQQDIQSVCGAGDTACIYDYAVSGSQGFAMMTKQTRDSAVKANVAVKNSLPSLQVPENVTVMPNKPAKFQISATDEDVNDTVMYKLVEGVDESVSLDPNTGEISVTLTAELLVPLQVYAVDSMGGQSVVLSISFILCSGCSGHGTCDYSRVQQAVGSQFFQRAVCECSEGWAGPDCEEDYDACASSPCHPLQTCTDLRPGHAGSVGYSCSQCPAGYISPQGQANECLDVDECEEPNDCKMNCTNTAGSYLCSCPNGYRLSHDFSSCEDINECALKTDQCEHKCSNLAGGFECSCEEGFAPNATNPKACVAISGTNTLCSNMNCDHACRVSNTSTGSATAECFCRTGYDLDFADNTTCKDHNECLDSVRPCSQYCNNTEGGFNCSCYSGYHLDEDERTCIPCPELKYGPNCLMHCHCQGRAQRCDPVTGCVCQPGWTGSGCEDDIDECEDPDVCPEGQVCTNNNGSFDCRCPQGYLQTANGTSCEDIDECAVETACGQLQKCTNIAGSYLCTCLPGYSKAGGDCQDVDECRLNRDNCQQRCVNVDGSFNCECYYGYRLNADRANCSLMSDPCAEAEGLDCEQGCTLKEHSDHAECFCNTGYELEADNQTCKDVDECAMTDNTCSHNCTNTEGGYMCSCPPGMKLDNDGVACLDCPNGTYGHNCASLCECGMGASHCDAIAGCVCLSGWEGNKCDDDVNECLRLEEASQQCRDRKAVCLNTRGSYACRCEEGYAINNGTVCQDIDECVSSPCSQKCENVEGGYQCQCYAGFSMDKETGNCADVDECALSSTHNCSQRCENTDGSYRCSCDIPGYQLDNGGLHCVAKTTCNRKDCDSEHGGCDISTETCFCNSRYELDADNITCTLQHVDWCAQHPCEQLCHNTSTSFTCSCEDGFLLNEDSRTCRECTSGTFGENCQSNCTCKAENTVSCNHVNGTCDCKKGWKGDECSEDVDECESSPCSGHTVCQNVNGSYLCPCAAGFRQHEDGSCRACPKDTYGVNCQSNCTCDKDRTVSCNSADGTCVCQPGWQGHNCSEDINECETMPASCGQHATCNNSDGGFDCHCDVGYSKDTDMKCTECPEFTYGKDCLSSCNCNETRTTSCDYVSGVCHCVPGWRGDTCELDVNECENDPCNEGASCNNTPGSFDCVCGDGYTYDTDTGCAAVGSLDFTLVVDVRVTIDLTVDSPERRQLMSDSQQKVYEQLSLHISSLISVEITDISAKQNEAASGLFVALGKMDNTNLTFGNLTGSTGVKLGNRALGQMSSCEVLTHLTSCDEGGCEENDGVPSCRTSRDAEDQEWIVVVAVCSAVPGLAIVIGIVACLVYRSQKQKRAKEGLTMDRPKHVVAMKPDYKDTNVDHPLDGPYRHQNPYTDLSIGHASSYSWADYAQGIGSGAESVYSGPYEQAGEDSKFTIKRPRMLARKDE